MVACEIPVLGILKVSRSIRFSFISLFFWPLQKSWHEMVMLTAVGAATLTWDEYRGRHWYSNWLRYWTRNLTLLGLGIT